MFSCTTDRHSFLRRPTTQLGSFEVAHLLSAIGPWFPRSAWEPAFRRSASRKEGHDESYATVPRRRASNARVPTQSVGTRTLIPLHPEKRNFKTRQRGRPVVTLYPGSQNGRPRLLKLLVRTAYRDPLSHTECRRNAYLVCAEYWFRHLFRWPSQYGTPPLRAVMRALPYHSSSSRKRPA